MILPLGFNFKQAVEIQSLSKKGFGLQTEVLYCLGHKEYKYIKAQPPAMTHGCELGWGMRRIHVCSHCRV